MSLCYLIDNIWLHWVIAIDLEIENNSNKKEKINKNKKIP